MCFIVAAESVINVRKPFDKNKNFKTRTENGKKLIFLLLYLK